VNLDVVEIPDDAEERAWRVVAAAYAERIPAPPERRRLRLAVVTAAVALALIVVGVSPAGRDALGRVREAIGVKHAAVALARLPAPGRLIVDSSEGPWLVAADGSKRRLGSYQAAAWSPHGRFEVATRRHEVAALDPEGNVRWSLARNGPVRFARWSPDGYRVAYLSGQTLRVVAGDGSGDHLLTRNVAAVAPAWQPGAGHTLAYVEGDGSVFVTGADDGVVRAHWREGRSKELVWSADGALLLSRTQRLLVIYTAAGTRVEGITTRSFALGSPFLAAAWAPKGRRLAFVTYDAGRNRSDVTVEQPSGLERHVFSGTGRITQLAWSPDGRLLLLGWPTADQWLFVRTAGPARIRGVGSISGQFHSSTFPTIAGWCCSNPR
jgi:dipeptidyl aminopeptidase/acylaminoacyl peptidase